MRLSFRTTPRLRGRSPGSLQYFHDLGHAVLVSTRQWPAIVISHHLDDYERRPSPPTFDPSADAAAAGSRQCPAGAGRLRAGDLAEAFLQVVRRR